MAEMDLSALFAELETVQAQAAKVRLSDRMVVELMNKLKRLGFFGDELLHTMNGREYITKSRVSKEIIATLEEMGGRISVVDLPSIIGVDLLHCEAQASRVVEESGKSVFLIDGELISTAYLTGMAIEINEMIQATGSAEIGDIAKRFALAAEHVYNCVKQHLGTIIEGNLEGSVLFTPAYVQLVKGVLRGALRAASTPLPLTAVIKRHALPGTSSITPKLLTRLVQELVNDGQVKGSLKSGVFTPDAYTKAQANRVTAFYDQNGYIEYAMLSKLGVSAPKTFLRSTLAGGHELQTVYAAPTLAAELEVEAEAGLARGGYVDVRPSLPPVLTAADVAQLLPLCTSIKDQLDKGDARIVGGHFLVASAMLKACWDAATSAAKDAAKRSLISGPPAGAAPSVSKAATASKAPDAADDDDDWDAGPKRKGKKGKGSKKKGGSSKAASAMSAPAPSAAAEDPNLPTANLLASLIKDRVDVGTRVDAELAASLADEVLGDAVSCYKTTLKEGLLAESQEDTAAAEKVAADSLWKFKLYHRGLEGIRVASSHVSEAEGEAHDATATAPESDSDAELSALGKHLLRVPGGAALDGALVFLAYEGSSGDDGVQHAAVGSTLSTSERQDLVSRLPEDLKPRAKGALEAFTGGSDAAECIAALDGVLHFAGARLKALDKKSEKAAVASERAEMLERLTGGSMHPADAFSLAIVALIAKHYGKLLSLPGRSISYALTLLAGFLMPDDRQLLDTMHKAVLAMLTAASKRGQMEGSDLEIKVHEAALREYMPKLIELCTD